MEYLLAKELKDAGFPMIACGDKGCPFRNIEINDVGYHTPTLSELIEACGEGFGSLDSYKARKRTGEWRAQLKREFWIVGKGAVCYGLTPEEAVARLWLALQGGSAPQINP